MINTISKEQEVVLKWMLVKVSDILFLHVLGPLVSSSKAEPVKGLTRQYIAKPGIGDVVKNGDVAIHISFYRQLHFWSRLGVA